MSDDTRQARIEAALRAWYIVTFCGGQEPVNYHLIKWDTQTVEGITAALDAADAVGRERVSERTKEHVYIAINNALASHIDISSDTDWWDEVIVEMGDAAMDALLTAAPAERGTGEPK